MNDWAGTTVFRLSKPQAKIFNSPKRFVVVNAGRRFGKSWVAGAKAFDKCQNNKNKNVIYIAPTLNMARNIMWNGWFKDHVPDDYIAQNNEQLMTVRFHTGSTFYCLSAEHPDRLRGLAADLLIVDECAIIDDSFYDVVRPLLSDRFHDGEALYISTPNGYNWFHKLFVKAKENPKTWDCFEYTTIEGGNVTEEEIEEARKELSPKMFAQEYLASFESVAARIYENYDRILNLCDKEETWGQVGDIHVGMDFNVNPMTAVISYYERGNLYIFDEIVEPNSNTQEMADMIKRRYPNVSVFVYPDPTGNKRQTNAVTGQTDFDILRKNGFFVCAPSHPYATKDKFNTVNAALKNAKGERKVHVVKDRCLHLKEAWEGYTYNENGDPIKSSGLDHISDAAAYLICFKLPYRSERYVRRPEVWGI